MTAHESPFGPLDEHGHDGHAPQLNGLLADCPGCATPVYGCCQHCTDHDRGEEWCDRAPHDDACVEPYCSGGRPVFQTPATHLPTASEGTADDHA